MLQRAALVLATPIVAHLAASFVPLGRDDYDHHLPEAQDKN
jgi:hypothetical protein